MPPGLQPSGATGKPRRLSLPEALRVAKDEAQAQGFVFAKNCLADLTQLLATLPADQPPDPTKDEKDQEAAIRELVRAMAEVAVKKNFAELFEDTLREAKFALCPIWPFC